MSSGEGDDLERGEDMNNTTHQSPRAGVFRIHTAVAGFRRLANTIGTPKDNLQLRQRLQNTRLQIGQLVKETSAKLKQVVDNHDQNNTQVPVLKGFFQLQPAEEIANAKLAKDLQSVLKEFQKAHILAAERDRGCDSFTPEDTLSSCNNAAFRSPNNAEQISFTKSMRHEAIFLKNDSHLLESTVEEREQGMKEIQQQIIEVNDIFRDLADHVHEQGIAIEGIISPNTEMCSNAITHAKLEKTSENHNSHSSMTCLLFVIFGVVLFIVAILFAAS